ncbi:LPXTG cell wall anchor domain-containing protein [Lactiplantibacillus garii]|uniref:LPXTG cell wall anchor domain-containing protein n=1 Tax=Lactiplantibacillus garii TaxID=2306423 RepID=A0A426DAP0_9LACO|nr:MucBP domain-containing protein [Lactiplantibacillus garii]RRK11586.1 LPXTG cell wall anchor domain-containing protein [Lactiplantibacillus garii]
MRLTKLQKIQTITQQNRHQQFKRTWVTTLVLLGCSIGIGTGLWTLPATAATVNPPTTTLQTAAATSTGASGPRSPVSGTPRSVSVASAPASLADSVTPTSTVSSAAAAPTSSSSATSRASVGFTAPTIVVTAPGSSFGTTPVSAAPDSQTSSVASTASATSTTSAATSTASQVQAAASIAALPDSTVVTFGDAGIQAAVAGDLGVTGPVTLGAIRNFSGPFLNIGTTKPLAVTGTLAGMQYLQALPASATIQFWTTYAKPNVDLTPLENDEFSQLSLQMYDMAQANLQPLTLIDPSAITSLQLVGSITGDMRDYQNNADGMTNAQLAELGPWLTNIDNTSIGANLNFNLSNNSLTDFSPLSGFANDALFVALGQRVNDAAKPVNLVVGQPAVFTALPLVGMNGESLTSHYQATLSGSPTQSSLAVHPAEPDLTSLGNGRFQIATAYPTIPNANWFAYGLRGYYDFTSADQFATNFIQLTYPSGVNFQYDVMVYQPANWLPAPELNVRYVDATTQQAIQPANLIRGTTIGSTYDLAPQTKIAGYVFDPQQSSPTTGTYTQDPQALTLTFSRQPAGGITVSYETTAGQKLAPDTVLSGTVGQPYQSQPLTITGYTYQRVATTSLPASGTLPLAAGTVTYLYTANQLTRIVRYVDVTTNQVLTVDQVTGPYMGTTTLDVTPTITKYTAAGYRVVTNGVPAAAAFDDPAPTVTYQVALAHQLKTLTATTPNLPANVVLTAQATRTIRYQSTDGTALVAPTVQTVAFTRQAVRDQVTGNVTYGSWVVGSPSNFMAVTSPDIRGYRADRAVVPASEPLNMPTVMPDVTVTYTVVVPATSAGSAVAPETSAAMSAVNPATSSAGSAAPVSTSAISTAPSTAATGVPSPNMSTTSTLSGTTPQSVAASAGQAATSESQSQRQVQATVPINYQRGAVRPAVSQHTNQTKSNTTAPLQRRPKVGKPARRALTRATGLPQTGEHPTVTALIGVLMLALITVLAHVKRSWKRIF